MRSLPSTIHSGVCLAISSLFEAADSRSDTHMHPHTQTEKACRSGWPLRYLRITGQARNVIFDLRLLVFSNNLFCRRLCFVWFLHVYCLVDGGNQQSSSICE